MKPQVKCLYCGAESLVLWAQTAVWHCLMCDLYFRYPQPKTGELADYYETGWQEPSSSIISGATDLVLAEVYTQRLLCELGQTDCEKMHLLEFGAGSGAMVTAVTNAGGKVTAVEPFGFDYLQQKGFDVYPQLEVLPPQQFDGIYSIQVLEHLPKPWEVLRELYTYLKPGGWLYVSTIYAKSLSARIYCGRWREAQNPGHLFFFTSANLERLLGDAGYGRIQHIQSTIAYPNHTGWRKNLNKFIQKARLGGELCYLAWRL